MSDETKDASESQSPKPADDAGFKAALKRHNDDAYALAREAWQAAERHRAEADSLKVRVPADGATVLSGDDAAAFAKYRELGTIEDIAAKIAERDSLSATIAAHESRKAVEAAAKPLGFDPDVLETLLKQSGVSSDFEYADSIVQGKKASFPHVKSADGKPIRLDEFAAKAWPKFLPALKAAPSQPASPRVSTVPVPPDPSLPKAYRRSLVR